MNAGPKNGNNPRRPRRSPLKDWCAARAPVVAARRRALKLLGDKEAVSVLFGEIAPRFAERDGGYTRVLRLAQTRLGDAGTQAILEFVGQHDRVAEVSERPAFDGEVVDEQTDVEDELVDDQEVAESEGDESAASDDTTVEEEDEKQEA